MQVASCEIKTVSGIEYIVKKEKEIQDIRKGLGLRGARCKQREGWD
jgi:hypothetical protein